jgi:uncharacterized membrane-anchored protein
MKKIFVAGSLLAGGIPLVTFATNTTAFDILATVAQFLGYVTPVLVAIAVIFFIYTVIKYTMVGDAKAKEEARKNIVPALIGLFVMVAFWGILTVVSNTLGVGPEQLNPSDIPCIPNPDLGVYCNY